ncbi:ubiquinone anaerobic biosynthesis accessory factor UbiT [Pseudomonas aeruginosa]
MPLAAKVPRGLQHLVRNGRQPAVRPAAGGGAFDPLEGRWLRLEVRTSASAGASPGYPAALRPSNGHGPAWTIRGDWRAFLLLASRHEDPDTLLFRRRLVIEGDTPSWAWRSQWNLLDSLDSEHLPPWLWSAVEWAGRGRGEGRGAPGAGPGARGWLEAAWKGACRTPLPLGAPLRLQYSLKPETH